MTEQTPQANDPRFHHVGGPPQSPTYPVAAPPPKRKRSTLWIVLGIAGALLLACCGIGTIFIATSKTTTNQNAASNGATQPQAPSAAKIGTPVRDGKFEFVVSKVQCGVPTVGDNFLNKQAQGQFCLVTVQIKNIGAEAQTFDDSNQHGYGTGNIKYDADATAGLYANKNDEAFFNNINPGNSVTATIVFDIAKDGQLLKVELHDSAFSGGVMVGLK